MFAKVIFSANKIYCTKMAMIAYFYHIMNNQEPIDSH